MEKELRDKVLELLESDNEGIVSIVQSYLVNILENLIKDPQHILNQLDTSKEIKFEINELYDKLSIMESNLNCVEQRVNRITEYISHGDYNLIGPLPQYIKDGYVFSGILDVLEAMRQDIEEIKSTLTTI